MDVLLRKKYIDKVIPFIDKDLIKIFVGQRRVGKSYLLKMVSNYINGHNTLVNIIYIDKEDYKFDFVRDYHSLIAYVGGLIDDTKKNYLFIDEIQEILGFEKALRHFQNKRIADIYITGSNADLLSGDLATLLSGRYIKVKINPLSYNEFLVFHNFEDNNITLLKYLKWGGLPYLRNLDKNDEVIFDYLSNILSTIVYKDIIHRYKIRNVEFFDRLIYFIAANSGNLITSKRISDYLKSQRIDISPRIVLTYLKFLQNAFLINKLKRFDLKSKKIFEINDKYFFEDIGLRNSLLGLESYSVPDLLENVVFSHLQYMGYSVNVGILNNREIDFVARKIDRTLYIQVAYLIVDEKTKDREFGNLLLIKDNFPKYVLSMDSVQIGLNIHDFLKMEDI